ncbi:hypothetical protein BASA81_012816 [Batrachochytrium salamandrivorans]|nr:hypothetical protein BASA81_012816 [Batrachochytrium salamandrivorans]
MLVYLWLLVVAATAKPYRYSREELLESAFTAKQNLALGNVLDIDTKLADALHFNLELPNDELQAEVFGKLDRHPFRSKINLPIFSIQYFDAKLPSPPSSKAICQTRNGLQAAEQAMFHGMDLKPCGWTVEGLLREYLTKHPWSAQAKLLLGVWLEDYAILLKLAHDTNHPVAHLMLAQHFHQRRDLERTAIHLLQAVTATLHLVLEVTPQFEHVRLSQLDTHPELAESAKLVSSPESFLEYESHLADMSHEHPEYAFHLGELYAAGMPELGLSPNLSKAKLLYERAMDYATNGEYAGLAASRLAGMEADNRTAYELFTKSHALGEPTALLGLARFHRDGVVVPQNKTRAVELYLLASQAGLVEGDYEAYRVNQSPELLLRAANAGHVLACADHGQNLLLQLKFAEAIPWLLKAVRTDWTDFLPYDSKQALAKYMHGDLPAALQLYALADKLLWQVEAIMNRAFLLERSGDLRTAISLYQTCAVEWHIGEAYRKLGECYSEWATVVPIDLGQAAFWYRMGAQYGDAESAWQLG